MSTDVDGAAPSVAPDPDDGDQRLGVPSTAAPGADSGSDWVRAEMARLMAEKRSTRGRHARSGEPVPPAQRDGSTGPIHVARLGGHRPPEEPSGIAGRPAAGDLPENYVPRHSVLTPGPAADPSPPITGPIPVVGPPADPVGGAASSGTATGTAPPTGGSRPPAGPIGGPSLPPSGLPMRRRRGSGPGMPLQADGASSPAGAWSRPVVPHESSQRLGAPPETLGGPEPIPAWGLPLATPAQGLVVPDVVPDDLPDRTDGGQSAADGPSVAAPEVDPAARTDETPTGSSEEIADPPTAPHPVVVGHRLALSGPRVPAQRSAESARAVAPRPLTPRSIPVVGGAPEPGSTRVRVVLSERKGVARTVRTIKEVQEGTPVGALLRRDLIRSQLRVTMRFAVLTVLVLGSLPAVFAYFPQISGFHVLGIRLPWIVLGVLMYPFLVAVSWRYARLADRVEQNFADHVQDR